MTHPSAPADTRQVEQVLPGRPTHDGAGVKLLRVYSYSPDLNPIEMAFSKLKSALRRGATRTVKALMKLIGRLIKTFAPDECANYFRHAGYE